VPITQPRNVYVRPLKKSQLPSSYLDGTFLIAPKGKEADPWVDNTKLKMGLVTANGTSIAKVKKEKKGEEKKPFFPVVAKWNVYAPNAAEKRLGAPFPYEEENQFQQKALPKDKDGRPCVTQADRS